MNDELLVVVIYSKEDQHQEELHQLVLDNFLKDKVDLPVDGISMDVNSPKFAVRRKARSLLAQHGTGNTPLILLRKKDVTVRAIYAEEVKELADYSLLLPKKYEEALEIEVTLEEVEDFDIDIK